MHLKFNSVNSEDNPHPRQPVGFEAKVGLSQLVFIQPVLREFHVEGVAFGMQRHLWHRLGATDVVEQDREAQQHAQADQLVAVVTELGELVLGDVAAVAAHQQSEHLLVFARETGKVRVLDQVGAVLVVVVVRDVEADFVDFRCQPSSSRQIPSSSSQSAAT